MGANRVSDTLSVCTAAAFEGGYLPVPANAGQDGLAFRPRVAVALRGAPADWLNDAAQKLEALSILRENWDSYGALPINHTAIENARWLLTYLAWTQNVDAPAVGGTPDGTVGLSWDDGVWSIDAEVFPSGQIHYVYLDDRNPNNEREATLSCVDELVELLTQWT